MVENNLSFEVGSYIEVRSFIKGYRGAWFQCKIMAIRKEIAGTRYLLEYVDYPDEKLMWTKVYQKSSSRAKKQLMVRPTFPKVYHASNTPDVKVISEPIVVVNDSWKVGDFVDWLKDDCYWCGKITDILADNGARIELPPPPAGEGLSYEVCCKDLRPSLDWSPVSGWTVPISEKRKSYNPYAWVVNPQNQGEEKKGTLVAPEPSSFHSTSVPPLVLAGSVPSSEQADYTMKQPANCKQPAPNKKSKQPGLPPTDCSPKKIEVDEKICLNSTHSSTIDAAMMDLEELISRVKWIKDFLNLGTTLSGTPKSSWRFQEHHPSSTTKQTLESKVFRGENGLDQLEPGPSTLPALPRGTLSKTWLGMVKLSASMRRQRVNHIALIAARPVPPVP